MKRKSSATKNQKYLAIFLAVTMFLSAFMIFFTGNSKNSDDDVSTSETGGELITVPFSQIQGKHVQHEFNSIADGLEMSPEGVTNAVYVDLQKKPKEPPWKLSLETNRL
ncbi:hypothetical protein [Methanosarcina horonobensis]|uniref:hypothetical protein n=1 Tax=Methanosarcina horonobensis TaxID=418008 RepID=UPI000B11DF45|nr:hypothetical protein [Methanosarcina horonobensis]